MEGGRRIKLLWRYWEDFAVYQQTSVVARVKSYLVFTYCTFEALHFPVGMFNLQIFPAVSKVETQFIGVCVKVFD